MSHARAFEPQAMGYYCPPRPRTCRGVGADRAQLGCRCCECQWAAECWPRAMVARLATERGQWGTGLVPRVPKLRNSGRNQEPGIRFRFRASQIPVPGSCRNTDLLVRRCPPHSGELSCGYFEVLKLSRLLILLCQWCRLTAISATGVLSHACQMPVPKP